MTSRLDALTLEAKIVEKAVDLWLSFPKTTRTGDPILDLGLGYERYDPGS